MVSLQHSPVRPPSPPAGLAASTRLPEELRFRERLAASPRPVTAAGGRVWRAQEMDGPSPLPPLPSRFRCRCCCCCLGNGKQKPACAPNQCGEGVAAPRRVTARAGDA